MRALGLIVILVSSAAWAQRTDDVEAARDHYAKGKRLYDLGKFSEAAKEYEAAYQAKDDTALLFNIGQAYRLAGNYPQALLAYKAYLRNAPDAPNRAEVEARVGEMQSIVDQQTRTNRSPPQGTIESKPLAEAPPSGTPTIRPTSTVSEYRDEGRAKRTAGIALAASGVGIMGVGIAFAVVSKQAGEDAYRPSSDVYDPSADDRQKTFRAVDIACFVVGGLAAITGATLWIVGQRERRSRVMPAALLTPQSAAAPVSVRF